jgi:adenylate cyclase
MPADQDNGQDPGQDKRISKDAPGHTRKLTAILAADVAGYSRLMADDEGATVNTLTEYREVFQEHVRSHKGRIVDTAGDSVLATFDSVVEAVEAAVAVQRDLSDANEALQGHRKMHFRIGVNLGDIIVREDGTIYGDGVNVAARLESLAEPGGVMVSEDAYRQVEGKLGVGLEDAGEHEVKNIAKPVGAWRVLLDGVASADSGSSGSKGALGSRPKLVAWLVAVLTVVVGVAVWGLTIRVEAPQMVMADGTPTDDPVLAMPTGPSIAVLPMENAGGNSDDVFFSDGITEDILTRLSQFDGLTVIARSSSFQFGDQNLDSLAFGKSLGADYVLTGRVRRGATDIRITVELMDGKSGQQLWAKSYDRPLDVIAVFAVQDEITTEIADLVGDAGGLIFGAELKRAQQKAPSSIGSYDCVLLTQNYQAIGTHDSFVKAHDCLIEAVQRDPEYADVWASLAQIHIDEHFWPSLRTSGDPFDDARAAAQKALDIDPANQMALKVLAVRLFWQRDATGY